MEEHQNINSALPVIGENIDQYTILELIGRGSMGVVFAAIDQTLEREVAIKFLAPVNFAAPDIATIVMPEMKQRFVREARTIAMLSHPNAVKILAAELEREIPFIVMELVDGKPLSIIFERAKQLSLAETCNLGTQLADVLAYAWREYHIVHRDIKPGNVMMVGDGRCKLMDFGLAKVVEAGSSFASITKSGITMGSVLYKSPEQHRGDASLDFRSDMFSLGVLLYRAIAGHVPFPGGDEVEVYESKCAGLLEPIQEVMPGISDDMGQALEQMLEAEPDDRPDSYEVIKGLLASMMSEPQMLSVQGNMVPEPEPPRKPEPPAEDMSGKTRIIRIGAGKAPVAPVEETGSEWKTDATESERGSLFLPELQGLISSAQAGTMFGAYQVDELIGCGGMGVVFSGTDTRTGDSVALKFLLSGGRDNAVSGEEELMREADVISQLDHDAIVKVREFCKMGRVEFMVMDLFLGPEGYPVNLMDYATSFGEGDGLLDEEDACQITVALLGAVGYAHKHGIVHCDLKPENVLFQFGGYDGRDHWEAELKLTDFGVAKMVGEELVLETVSRSVSAFTGDEKTVPPDAAALIGTFEYMSPEQRRGEPATPLSDLFSVGMMVLRLLTGARELGLRNRPSQLRPGISTRWDDFILRALRERPADRYSDAAEMVACLAEIQSELS